ncbi:DUF397 domain-containing protein [Streptomyces carpaticus]|uniref:DUF397 domain-containing protein n=1 Tax=Streptomyces carpaticus TaxID=285558 RepID=UPI002201F234|nr:DUF397 domain-containing protein [Streptomyces carpaticus]
MSTTELAWFKSSYSGTDGDSCIEVALSRHEMTHPEGVHVRDSKAQSGPQLFLPPAAWTAFVTYAAGWES